MLLKISKNAASCSVVNFYHPNRKKVFIGRSQGGKQAVGDLIHFMRPFIAFYYSFLFACQSNGIKTPACAFADLLRCVLEPISAAAPTDK
jgi:hypothetical protein